MVAVARTSVVVGADRLRVNLPVRVECYEVFAIYALTLSYSAPSQAIAITTTTWEISRSRACRVRICVTYRVTRSDEQIDVDRDHLLLTLVRHAGIVLRALQEGLGSIALPEIRRHIVRRELVRHFVVLPQLTMRYDMWVGVLVEN